MSKNDVQIQTLRQEIFCQKKSKENISSINKFCITYRLRSFTSESSVVFKVYMGICDRQLNQEKKERICHISLQKVLMIYINTKRFVI